MVRNSGIDTSEMMFQVIEEYGFRRDILERSQFTDKQILRLYEMVKDNKRLRKENQMVSRLREYIEIKEI